MGRSEEAMVGLSGEEGLTERIYLGKGGVQYEGLFHTWGKSPKFNHFQFSISIYQKQLILQSFNMSCKEFDLKFYNSNLKFAIWNSISILFFGESLEFLF